MKTLQIHDGGCAPGYMAVAVGLTEEAAARGHEMYVAAEGFRSLTGDGHAETPFPRLVMRPEALAGGEPAVSLYRRIGDAGSEFRSERFPAFRQPEKAVVAAAAIRQAGFQRVIGVGGDGTFLGIRALARQLGPDIQVGFVNVSADSDLRDDVSVGFLTCAEEGARVAQGLFDDGYTHNRIYILEMMGNRSGSHVLHAGASARAHFIILPQFRFEPAIWQELAAALAHFRHGLITVAEGFAREERAALTPRPNAAEYVKRQLEAAGLQDNPDRRVIAEPFSRYIRGIAPSYLEREIAYLKSHVLFAALDAGRDRVMAYVTGLRDAGVRDFEAVEVYDAVPSLLLEILDRLGIRSFRRYLASQFATSLAAGGLTTDQSEN
ncbi:MAG: 6-phosphofructokinase [Chloroflexi bacterium]|nr:6-phosphofructokinase [Chloroflexota bacterium]